MAELIVSLKDREMARSKIKRSPFYFGRDASNDLHLDNPAISGTHFKIEFSNYEYILTDEGSSNGTFVNDKKIERHSLGHGDKIVIGKFVIDFRDPQTPPDVIEKTDGEHGAKKGGQIRSTVQLSGNDIQGMLQQALEKRDAAKSGAIAAPSKAANPTPAPSAPSTPDASASDAKGGLPLSTVIVLVVAAVVLTVVLMRFLR